MEQILTDINAWDGTQANKVQLEKQIKNAISREFHSFPANKETRDTHYFSRDILSQSILVNELGTVNIKKYVFSYDETPLSNSEAKYSLSESPVMTLVFIQGNNAEEEKTAIVFHIREASVKEFYSDKKIPIANIPGVGTVKNVVEIQMSLQKQGTMFTSAEKFEDLFEIKQISKYDPNAAANQRDRFRGSVIETPDSEPLKIALDQAIGLQYMAEFPSDGYEEVFAEIAKIIYPIKGSITNEAHLQAIMNGLFSSYSDLKLQESSSLPDPAAKIVVIPEFQTGAGGRVDMLIQAIGPSTQGTKEYTPVLLEFKVKSIKLSQGQKNELKTIDPRNKESKKKELLTAKGKEVVKELTIEQQNRYTQGAAIKAMTDSDKVVIMGALFNVDAKDADTLIFTSESFTPAVVVHSSTTMIGHNSRVRKATLESQTAKGEYSYWLSDQDIRRIVHAEYNNLYDIRTFNDNYENSARGLAVISAEHLDSDIAQFKEIFRDNSDIVLVQPVPLRTLILNVGGNHWVTLVISHQDGQYNGYYVDSLYRRDNTGNEFNTMPDNIRQILVNRGVNPIDLRIHQQEDGYNCGLWALENAVHLNQMFRDNVQDNQRLNWLSTQLAPGQRNEVYFTRRRLSLTTRLRENEARSANNERNISLGQCLNGSRTKRSTNGCLFSKDDVNEFIQENNQHNSKDKATVDLDKITLDSEKFIDYLKTDISDEKRAQLIELASKVKVVGNVNSRNIWLKSQETQQTVSMKLSNFLANKFPHAKITPIAQSLYLSEFEKGAVKTDDISTGINWALLKLPANERALFLQNLKTLKLLHNRLLQGQPISIREYKEYFALSEVLNDFSKTFAEKSEIRNNKKLVDLQNTINELKGDFTIYLEVSGNRAVIQRRDNLYSYLDSSIGYIEGLRGLSDEGQETQKAEILEVFEKANILSGHLVQPRLTAEHELEEDQFSIELIDQEEINQVLSATEKQKLISPIETERYRLSLQDRQLGKLKLEGSEIARTELYDLGMKLRPEENIKGSSELVTADMGLNDEKLKGYLTTKRISINADSYLTALVQHSESKRIILARTLKTVNFEGADHAIQKAQETQKLLTSTEDSQSNKYHLEQLLHRPTELAIQSMLYADPKVVTTKRWPSRLTNAAGHISMFHGGYSTIQALRYGDTTGFALGAGEMGFSLFSQLLENGVVKVTPQIIKQMKYGMHFSRGFAGLISSPFDAYDLIRSSIDASEATKGSKVWRDNIASATFAGTSIASSVVFTAVSMPGAGIVVGFGIIVGQGIYSGASMIVEYKKYHLTTDQEFRLFWHTFALQPLPKDVQYIQTEQERLNQVARDIWEQLKNKPEVVAYAMGLGKVEPITYTLEQTKKVVNLFKECQELMKTYPDIPLQRISTCMQSKYSRLSLYPDASSINVPLRG